jgi:hypothetical protein
VISPSEDGAGERLYQLKVTLKWSKPPIWRRIVVRGGLKLNLLHDVIQIAMGWTDSHLHQFMTGSRDTRRFYGVSDPEAGSDMLNERRYTVADLAPRVKAKFVYEYDFGDGWEHEIAVENILPPDPGLKHPTCLAGANACPPEDCGGIHGYSYLLEILANPEHPEYPERMDWLGDEFDPTAFSLEDVNRVLKRLKI